MQRHTQGSLAIVGMISGGIFLVSFVAFLVMSDFGVSASGFFSILIALIAAIVLYRGFGPGRATPLHEVKSAPTAARAAPTEKTETQGASTESAAASAAGGAAAASAASSSDTVGTDDPQRAGFVSDVEDARLEPKAASDSGETADASATDKDTDADTGVSGSESAAASVSAEGAEKPAILDAPQGEADDLKKIKGVGPKMEEMLNGMGFYHFWQIAAWGPKEVAWVDENLEGFKGRVSRDNWVDQAKLLAEGGDTEFSKKVDKGDVY